MFLFSAFFFKVASVANDMLKHCCPVLWSYGTRRRAAATTFAISDGIKPSKGHTFVRSGPQDQSTFNDEKVTSC